MRTIRFLMALVTSTCLASLAGAQETLTLQQAVKYALAHKAEAKNAQLDIENAEYIINETRAGALPQVNGSGTLTYNPMLQQSALPGELIGRPGETVMVAFGQKWQANTSLGVSQQLFNQALFTGLKAAKTTREFYIINKDLTDEQLIEKVANAYYQVFQLQLNLQTVQDNLDNTAKTRKVVSGLVDAGLMKKIDLDRLSVTINNLEASKQQVLNSLQLTENSLKFAIGMEMTRDIELPEETFDISAGLLATEPDFANRTEIRLLEKQTQLYELNKKAELASYYPSLSFSGNLGYLSMGPKFPVLSGDDNVKGSGFSGLSLNLNVPIFNGGATKARVNQAEISLRRAKIDLENTRLGLSLESENAKSQIKNSLLTVDANRRNVQMAKEVLDDTQNNYRNGLAPLTDLLEAENAYAEAQNNLNTSLLNYKVAEVQWIKANGNLKSLVNE